MVAVAFGALPVPALVLAAAGPDNVIGGFLGGVCGACGGGVDNNLRKHDEVPRAAVEDLEDNAAVDDDDDPSLVQTPDEEDDDILPPRRRTPIMILIYYCLLLLYDLLLESD